MWVSPQRERESVPGARPWFRTRTPFRRSEAMVRVLAGHGGDVNACALSPDGRRIVSASDDKTLECGTQTVGAAWERSRDTSAA